MNTLTRVAVAGAAAVLCVGGCSQKTDRPVETQTSSGVVVSPSGTAAAQRGTSMVRLINAIPGAAHYALVTDDRAVFADVAFKSATQYMETNQNVAKFALKMSGRDSVLADNNEVLMDGGRYTLVAMRDKDNKIHLRAFKDNLVPDSGKARVRFVNASAATGKVDVQARGAENPTVGNVDFAEASGPTDVQPGSVSFVVKPADNKVPTATLKPMALKAGHAATIVLAGANAGTSDVIVVDDDATSWPRTDARGTATAPDTLYRPSR